MNRPSFNELRYMLRSDDNQTNWTLEEKKKMARDLERYCDTLEFQITKKQSQIDMLHHDKSVMNKMLDIAVKELLKISKENEIDYVLDGHIITDAHSMKKWIFRRRFD